MKQLACALMILAGVACAGDDGEMPAPGSFGAECTTVVDTGSTECDSGVCSDTFDQLGHPVCSVRCTPGDNSTCPEGAEGKKCNMKGYCKP